MKGFDKVDRDAKQNSIFSINWHASHLGNNMVYIPYYNILFQNKGYEK